MNVMWEKEEVPRDWVRGVIVPFYKDGDKRDPLNYRGISLLSIVGKIYAGILNKRIMEFCDSNSVLVEEQGGFRRGRGCPDQLFSFLEIIRNRGRRRTYCCFIDIRKAYDRVFRDGLWKKMWDVNIRGRMWRVIVGMYNKVESCVRVNGVRTSWFDIDVGVRQGCVLSPVLFSIFINGLAEELKDLGIGVQYGEVLVSLLLYADDIVLFADSRLDLQIMLDTVDRYSVKWRFNVNSRKTQVVVFGGEDDREYELGVKNIKVVPGYKYLGLWIDKNVRGRWKKMKESMLEKARKRVAVAWGMALNSGCMSVRSGKRIWEALVRPVLEYGAEVWEEENNCRWEEAEKLQRKMGKRILGCGSRMSNEVVGGELGWWSLRGRRVLLRIRYWCKLVRMDRERLVRKIYEESRRQYMVNGMKNWCSYTHRLLKLVGLDNWWQDNYVGLDYSSKVYRAVRIWENDRWREGVSSKVKLEIYGRLKSEIGYEEYLDSEDVRGRRLLTKMGGGSNGLRMETGRWEGLDRNERECELCYDGVEDFKHVFLFCNLYEDLRKRWRGSLEICVWMGGGMITIWWWMIGLGIIC